MTSKKSRSQLFMGALNDAAVARRAVALLCLSFTGFISCSVKPTNPPENAAAPSKAAESIAAGEAVMARYRAFDSSRSSVTKLAARITDTGEGSTREVKLTMYRQVADDGSRVMLFQFTDPPEERDRNGLVALASNGDVEAVRYMQSTDRFVATTSVSGEDSLFGMSLQELVGGQSEKYEHRVIEETTVANTPV